MGEYKNESKYLRYSKTSGKSYNVFGTIRILNIAQATAYIENGVMPLDIYCSKDKTGKRVLVFLFDKEETKEVYDLWCKHEL